LVQDLFAHKVPAILKERPDLTQEELGRVLAVAARNLCIDRYRRKRRFPETELDPEIHNPGAGTDTDDAIADPEALLADLQPRYREVLTLKYLFQLTWEEVASRLGLSLAGARKRADQARKDILAKHPDRNALEDAAERKTSSRSTEGRSEKGSGPNATGKGMAP
jgi:RNA polymerase sigma factor (sigma-70 family)